MAWLTGWGFRKEITVQDTNVDGNLTDFPAYIDVTADADFHEARADGYDIRFTQSDGETLLKYEREYWTGGNGSAATAHFWVKVPSVLASGGATIYCYYGKSDAPDGEDAANVWDGNFQGVWHLKEASETRVDSSGNSNTLQDNNTVLQGDGKVYKCADFVRINSEYLSITDASQTGLDITGSMTIAFWLKADSFAASEYFLIKHESAYRTYFVKSENGTIRWRFADGTNLQDCLSQATLDTGTWYHIGCVFDPGNDTHLYINGSTSSPGNTASTALTAIYDNSAAFSLGGPSYYIDGLMDEVRISSIVRPAAWIKFEYTNMNEADNELTWGSEETSGYTIVATAGSYALSGQTTNLLKGSLVDVGAGSYSLGGQVASLLKGSHIDPVAGSYSLSGQVVGLLLDGKIDIAAGTYALSGQTIDLLKGSLIDIVAGSYALSGQVVALLRGSKVGIASGGYTLTGQVVSLLKGSKVSAGAGSFILTGQTASLLRGSLIDIGAGTYSLTGFAVDLVYFSGYTLNAEAGVYVLTGMDVDLDYVSLIYPIIFDVVPRERIFELVARTRIYDVSPRGRIFDREET